MKEADKFQVYKHTNLITGKVYIGASRNGWLNRWFSQYKNNQSLYDAIAETEECDWAHEVLASGLSLKEACAEETRQIALHDATNPDKGYNINPYSGGLRGGLDESTRRAQAEHHLGTTHSDEELIKIARTQRVRWANGQHRGSTGKHLPKAEGVKEKVRSTVALRSGKPVRCLDTGIVYPSIDAAARGTGLKDEQIKRVLKGKQRTTQGLRFEYADPQKETEHSVRVICVETGAIYESMKSAARLTGAPYSGISSCCAGRRKTAGGYHWETDK